MYSDLFENSEWDDNLGTTLLFTLKLSQRYGQPSTWFIREECAIIPNQALREVNDNISRQGTSHQWSSG